MKFAADCTVGKLARLLRFLGYDTVCFDKIAEEEFLALANSGRILLSRNSELVKKARPDHFLLVGHNEPRAQLMMVLKSLDLTPKLDRLFSRCTKCNGMLESVERQAVWGSVPDHVWASNKRFSKCVDCGKLYWPGSHLARYRQDLNDLFRQQGSAVQES
jgi:uncharacterized protein with PIN domain